MNANAYERTYVVVEHASNAVKHLDEVVSILKAAKQPMTCKEIGIALFGEREYLDSWRSRSHSAHLGQILSHLVEGKFVNSIKIDGAPVRIETWEYICKDSYGNPRRITVHDDEGNTYEIDNPKYDPRSGCGHQERVRKTIIPKIKTYKWIAEI